MTTQALEELRRTNREIADAIAPGWERHRAFIERTTVPVRDWMLRELAPQPGQTLLELAAGPGDTGFDAVERAGDGARLISTDLSPAMLDVARRRGAERGIGHVEYRCIDIERIDLDDDCADGVLCRFAYMLVADPATALAETRRVLRRGGRLVLAVWGAPDHNPFFVALGMTLVRAGHLPPLDRPSRRPLQPGHRRARAGRAAGRGVRRGARRGGAGALRGPHSTSTSRSPPTRRAHGARTPGAHPGRAAQLAGPLGDALDPFRTEAGYEVPGLAIAAVATC